MNDNGWREWQKYVLSELKTLSKSSENQEKRLNDLFIKFTALETNFKSRIGLWGFLGGLTPILIAIAVWLIKSIM